jgi:hypothetical protein
MSSRYITYTLFSIVAIVGVSFSQQLGKDAAEREKKFQERAAAQDTTSVTTWKHTMGTGLNLTQVSFKDWAQGGENALSYAVYLNGASTLTSPTLIWGNSYKFNFGQTRLGSQGLRKTDDDIYLESLLIYKLGTTINPYFAATLRTQFAKGYQYDNAGNETPVSKFFDPGYLTQSIGVAFQPAPEVKTRFGFAMREILTSQFNAYADDPGTTEIEKTRVEGGLESVTDVAWTFAENMTLTSHLELFDPMNHLDQVVARWDNVIVAKVNKIISASFGVQVLNDVNVSPKTQIKQVLAIGLSYTIL